MCFLLLMVRRGGGGVSSIYAFPLSSQVAELVGASLELGCLLAGVAISSQGHLVVEQVCADSPGGGRPGDEATYSHGHSFACLSRSSGLLSP